MEFIYEAKTEENGFLSGSLTAESEREAVRKLHIQGLFVTKLNPAEKLRTGIKLEHRSHLRFAAGFFRQLAVMIRTDIPLNEALENLLQQSESGKEKEVLSGMCRTVHGGGTLASAMRAYPTWFPKSSVAIVNAGEESGTLDRLLAKIADTMEKQYDMKEKRVTLLAYPAILLLTSVAAAAVLLAFVFPVFVSFFAEMHTELPWPTRLVICIYDFLGNYGFLLAACVLAALAECARRYREPKTRERADRMLLRLPVFGRLVLYQELSRLAGTLAVLIESGIVLNRALEITAEAAENAYVCSVSMRAGRDVEKGFAMSSSFEKAELFPPMFLNLLRTGERTGAVEEMLYQLASSYEAESERLAERMHTLLEPCMVLVAGGVIGTLIFSVALPILDMMTSLSGS
ncbi:type II secretion system F family protein [Schwartzia sp. (in: firmicutes)]